MSEEMTALPDVHVTPDPWDRLRRFTAARIALGRTGASVPTREVLDFGLAHARARDAVHTPLDVQRLCGELAAAGQATVVVRSAAADRTQYLLRPDLGRCLDDTTRPLLASVPPCDLVFVLGDGLSAIAIQRHAVPVLGEILARLPRTRQVAPVVVATLARVALGDDIGAALKARMVVMLIGERPGLSAPDSLGAYLTYAPARGTLDAARNCVSNIRPEGLAYPEAAHRIVWLIEESLRRALSGVQLKDESDQHLLR